jgi:hypothetical protein
MQISPEEAAKALDEIARTRHRTLRNAPPLFPSWYLSFIWGGITVVQFATEVLHGPASWAGVAVVLAALAVAVVKFLRDMFRLPMRPHRSVVDPWAWAGFAGWIVGTQVLCFALLAVFGATGLPYPRTFSSLAVFAVALVTAPALPRWMALRNARRAEATDS